jgi:tetratricopeptide (TPR) repeat protein
MRYERVRLLGKGATAETFLSRDLHRGGRLVALKIFSREWAEERPDRIDREFQTLSALHHPFIAAIEDYGIDDGRPYLASEFVDGPYLLEALRTGDVNRTAWFFLQLLEALDYLYFRNVVHLDLQPKNVLVQKDSHLGPRVKLIDFGLAALSERPEAGTEAVGTPPYTAPEFALRRALDTRSDLYSVGALLYEALAGRPPFAGGDPIVLLNRQLQSDPAPLEDAAPGIPRAFATFVARLLSRDPQKRFENPHAAVAGLKAAMGESVPTARSAPVPVFEDPDLIFREREGSDLLEGVATRGGRWAVEGEPGMGKTFLARWLQRELWRLGKKVLRLSGERIVLEEPPPESILLIDDADRGPVEAWLERRDVGPVVLFGRSLPWAGAKVRRLKLEPLASDQAARAIRRLMTDPEEAFVRSWIAEARGSPLRLVRRGRERASRGFLEKEGRGWKTMPSPAGPEMEDASERLAALMAKSRVALDTETLSIWTGLSVPETEEIIDTLVSEGRLERHIEAGRVLYGALDAGDSEPDVSSLPALPAADPVAFFQTLYDEGRYAEGVGLLDRFFAEGLTDSLRLMKARLLAGIGRHDEVLGLLTPDFFARLSPLERAQALETLGKSCLFAGLHPQDREALGEAAKAYAARNDFGGLARSLLHLGILAQRLGDEKGAEGFYAHALRVADLSPKRDLLSGAIFLNLANLHFDAARWEKAEPIYRDCLERLSGTGHGAILAQAHLNLANLSFYQGKLLQAEHQAREALRLAVDRRYPLTQGRALLLLSMVDEARDRTERQGERLSEALFVLEEAGQSFERVVVRIHRAYFLEAAGFLPESENEARRAWRDAEGLKAPDLAAQSRLILGKILSRDRARDEEAVVHLEAARSHFSQGRNLQMSWECDFEFGEFQRTRGRVDEARVFYRKALETVDRLTQTLTPAARESFLRDRKREKVLERIGGG